MLSAFRLAEVIPLSNRLAFLMFWNLNNNNFTKTFIHKASKKYTLGKEINPKKSQQLATTRQYYSLSLFTAFSEEINISNIKVM